MIPKALIKAIDLAHHKDMAPVACLRDWCAENYGDWEEPLTWCVEFRKRPSQPYEWLNIKGWNWWSTIPPIDRAPIQEARVPPGWPFEYAWNEPQPTRSKAYIVLCESWCLINKNNQLSRYIIDSKVKELKRHGTI